MKKTTALISSALIAFALCIPSPVFAESTPEKEEVVYGNLDWNGAVEKVYAVNIFEDDKVVDYGDYSEVKNLTTSDKLDFENGKITAKASETPFYYQGILNDRQLPWTIDINYYMDGRKCDAQELAGRSGTLEIDIDIDKNENDNSSFYENYALQVTVTLDGNFCRNIEAEGATAANVGSDKQLTYTILPDKGSDIRLYSDVTNFEMSEISINAVKLNMDIDVDTSELTWEAEKLQDGTEALDTGAGEVNSGAGTLAGGSRRVLEGVRSLKQNVSFAAYKSVMKSSGLDMDQLEGGNMEMIRQAKALLTQYGELMSDEQKASCKQLITLLEGNNAAIHGTEAYLDRLNSEMGTLMEGVEALAAGSESLYSGTSALKKGTGTLKKNTAGIDEKIEDKIDSIKSEISGSDEIHSFISDKNTNVKSVQFVLKTKPIELP
ncbi:MAG: hypothetical protein ACI4KL_02185 [Lentihominibacter sp.]